MLSVAPIYAAVLTLLFVALSFRVIAARRLERVAVGDGGHRHLLRRQRVHANFAEYCPLALLLIAMAEIQGASGVLIHGFGILLLAARVIHAVGVSREPEPLTLRVIGMVGTFVTLIAAALTNLTLALGLFG